MKNQAYTYCTYEIFNEFNAYKEQNTDKEITDKEWEKLGEAGRSFLSWFLKDYLNTCVLNCLIASFYGTRKWPSTTNYFYNPSYNKAIVWESYIIFPDSYWYLSKQCILNINKGSCRYHGVRIVLECKFYSRDFRKPSMASM